MIVATRFTVHPSGLYPVMHYKYFSNDEKWLPAKKDADGHVIFTVSAPDAEGVVHKRWETDADGIQLVHSWPNTPPSQLAPIDKHWHFEPPPATGGGTQERKDSIATVIDSVDKYAQKGMDRGSNKEDLWSQGGTDFWAAWAEAMAKVTDISDFESKPKYCTHDQICLLHMPRWALMQSCQLPRQAALGALATPTCRW